MQTKETFPIGLSYDDILLIPQYSDITSRRLIDLSSHFSRHILLKTPIVSANMDTVTESQMAIVMALRGGIGIIHRFLTIEEQTREVKKVKRAENLIIEDPFTITKEATLADALRLMKENNVSGLVVCDKNKVVEGILTRRDICFKIDPTLKVKELMTPQRSLITAPVGISPTNAIKLLDKHKIEKLPIVDRKNRLAGLITASDFKKTHEHTQATKDAEGRLMVGAAVGVKDGVERAAALVKAGCDVLVIDIAHGHHARCIDLVKLLKKNFKDIDVVAGNVATAAGAQDLIKAGADSIKVGIGPGAACSTRVVAGAGVPQFSAIREIAPLTHKLNIPLIADGGIKNPGDVAKALAAGASTVMIGNLFSGSLESPGEYYIEEGVAFKVFRGMASRDASSDRPQNESGSDRDSRAPEGISFRVTYKGEVSKILRPLVDGLQSGMSYTGAKNIKEFWRKAQFIRMTEAGLKESFPRPGQH